MCIKEPQTHLLFFGSIIFIWDYTTSNISITCEQFFIKFLEGNGHCLREVYSLRLPGLTGQNHDQLSSPISRLRTQPKTSQTNPQPCPYTSLLGTHSHINLQRIYIYRKYVHYVGILLSHWIRVRNLKRDCSIDESLLQSNSLMPHGHAELAPHVLFCSADEERSKLLVKER